MSFDHQSPPRSLHLRSFPSQTLSLKPTNDVFLARDWKALGILYHSCAVCVCIFVYLYMYNVLQYVYTYMYVYTYIYIYTYICVCARVYIQYGKSFKGNYIYIYGDLYGFYILYNLYQYGIHIR